MSRCIDTMAFLSNLLHMCQHYHSNYHKRQCNPCRCHWNPVCIRIWNRTFRERECNKHLDRNVLDPLWLFHMDLCIRRDSSLPLILCCDSADMVCMRFAVIPIDRSPSCIRCTCSKYHSDMYPVDTLATSTLRRMKHPLSVWFDPVDMRRMLVECLENGMCLLDKVRNVYRCPIVGLMNIRRDTLREKLLRPNALFGQDRTTSMQMIPHPVGRIRGHMSDISRFPNPNTCLVDSVPCNRLRSERLDQLWHRYDRWCLDISSIAIVPFPIGMCLVDMGCMSYSIGQSMCQQHMELMKMKKNKLS